MKKRRINFPVKTFFLSLIIFLALLFILGYIWRVLLTADYFRVKDILDPEAKAAEFSYLKGKNIFSLDLNQEAALLLRNCPDCSRVRLARILPDRVFVQFIRRKPLALIKLYRYFAVDQDGFVFYSSIDPETENLPVILGLETKIFGLKPGSRCLSEELTTALFILREAAKNRLLKDYRIQKIDIAGPDNITLKIPLAQKSGGYANWKAPERKEFLEVKISQAQAKEKIVIMAGLINQERGNLSNIKYIDLRFKEPVIKFKDAK